VQKITRQLLTATETLFSFATRYTLAFSGFSSLEELEVGYTGREVQKQIFIEQIGQARQIACFSYIWVSRKPF